MDSLKTRPGPFWASVLVVAAVCSISTAAIIQAVIPQVVPTANKTASAGTIFQLAKSTTPGSAGQTLCDDGTGQATYTGCTANAVTSTSPVTVNTNTTSDQQLMELSLSAGYLNSLGKPFTFFGAGVYTTQLAQTPTLTFKIKLCTVSGCGSGTVVTLINILTTASVASITNNNWNLTATAVTATAGATGNLEIHGPAVVDLGATTATADSVFSDTNTAVSSNIDLTAALFVDFTITFSTNAATANTCTQREGVVSPGGSTSGGGGGGGAGISQGTFASIPGTCTPNGSNAFYIQTDGPYQFNCSSTNTYSAFLETWGIVTVPPSSSWTQDNLSTGSANSTNGYRAALNLPTGGGSTQMRAEYQTAPSTPYSLVVGMRHNIAGTLTSGGTAASNNDGYGINFGDGTGKYVTFMNVLTSAPAYTMQIDNWTNSTTYSANVSSYNFAVTWSPEFETQSPQWFCIADDGTTNLTFSWSLDRRNWHTYQTVSRTAFLASGPTRIGYHFYSNTGQGNLQVLDWTINTSTTCK